jgi:hypothetical protein
MPFFGGFEMGTGPHLKLSRYETIKGEISLFRSFFDRPKALSFFAFIDNRLLSVGIDAPTDDGD